MDTDPCKGNDDGHRQSAHFSLSPVLTKQKVTWQRIFLYIKSILTSAKTNLGIFLFYVKIVTVKTGLILRLVLMHSVSFAQLLQ